jgi:hypothetical protein
MSSDTNSSREEVSAAAPASRDVIWFVLADPEDAEEWKRTFGVRLPDGVVFVPGSYYGCEHTAMLAACEDGFTPELWGHRWYVPSRWLSRQRPGLRPTLEAIERIAQEQMRDE